MKSDRPHRAKKSLGQNFLVDQNICHKIVDHLKATPDDSVLEIGPGRGALTQILAQMELKRLVALEKDDDLAEDLSQRWPHIELLNTDALAYDWQSLDNESWKIIGNLPYNIASKLIWDILSRANGLKKAVFMVQHEVALRLTAKPGTKQYGGLTVWVNNFADSRYAFKVPPEVFRPKPRIDSAIVEFFPISQEDRPAHPDKLSTLIKTCFQKRRKQLSNILKLIWNKEVEEWFERNDISPKSRPETLSPLHFESLSRLI